MGDLNAWVKFLVLLLMCFENNLCSILADNTIEVAIIADVLDITERHQQRNRSEDELKQLFNRELYLSAMGGDTELVRRALESDADPDGINRNGFTPLHAAAFKGYLEITRLLLLYGASVNARAHNGETPLHFAASHGNTAVVGLLIGNGADVDSVDEDGRSPIWVASFYGNSGALKAMLAARDRKGIGSNSIGYRSLKNGVSPMFAAAQEGHLEAVRLLFQAGESPDNDHNSLGQTPLLAASANGHKSVVEFLIRASRDPKRLLERRDEGGRTALFVSACAGHLRVTAALSDSRANLDAVNSDGQTPLFCAARRNRTRTAAYLVAKGANVNIKDDNQMSALYAASFYGHSTIIRVLLRAKDSIGRRKVDVEAKSGEGFTPMLIAAQEGQREALKILVEEGQADLDAQNNADANALYWPSYFGRVQVVEYLIQKGIDIYHLDELGRSVLWAAVAGNQTDVAQILIRRGVQVNLPSKDGWTPLHVAAYFGRGDLTALLLDAGAETEVRTLDGQTPLYIANRRGHPSVSRLLLSSGADAASGAFASLARRPLFVAGQAASAAVASVLGVSSNAAEG